MLSYNFALCAVWRAKMKMDSAAFDLGALRRVAKQQRYPPNHLVAYEPSSRGAKGRAHQMQAEALGQIMKCHRCIGKETRPQARSEPRLRMPNLLPQGTRLSRRHTVEPQLLTADQLHVGACFVKQSSQVDRRSATTDYNHAAASEPLKIVMPKAV